MLGFSWGGAESNNPSQPSTSSTPASVALAGRVAQQLAAQGSSRHPTHLVPALPPPYPSPLPGRPPSPPPSSLPPGPLPQCAHQCPECSECLQCDPLVRVIRERVKPPGWGLDDWGGKRAGQVGRCVGNNLVVFIFGGMGRAGRRMHEKTGPQSSCLGGKNPRQAQRQRVGLKRVPCTHPPNLQLHAMRWRLLSGNCHSRQLGELKVRAISLNRSTSTRTRSSISTLSHGISATIHSQCGDLGTMLCWALLAILACFAVFRV